MLATFSHVMTSSRRYIFPHYRRYNMRIHRISVDCFHKGTEIWIFLFLLTWISCWTNSRASKEFSKGFYTWYLICVPDFRHFHPHSMEMFSALMADFEGNPLMTGVPPHNGLVMHWEFWPFIRSCLCSETPWCSCGVTVIETFIHSQYNPGCTINKAKQNKRNANIKSNSFDFTIIASLRKKVPRPNVDEINRVPSFLTPHACTQDPRFFSHKLLSKSFEIKPQLMMAAATGLPSFVDTKPGARAARACA